MRHLDKNMDRKSYKGMDQIKLNMISPKCQPGQSEQFGLKGPILCYNPMSLQLNVKAF